MSNKYVVRQPIKDAEGKILGSRDFYISGENFAFSTENSSAAEYASADTIYSFLTQNSTKFFKGFF